MKKLSANEWTRALARLASDLWTWHECKKCGHPVLDGYCCHTCGFDNSAATEGKEE